MALFMLKMPFLPSNNHHFTDYGRIIDLTAKENAYEDCLVAIKKAYEKDLLNLNDFLQVKICEWILILEHQKDYKEVVQSNTQEK